MQIYLAIAGKRHGPYAIGAVNGGIASGKMPLAGTLAWWEGCGEWRPLADVPGIDLPVRQQPVPPVPHPTAHAVPAAPPVAPAPPLVGPPVGDATGGIIPYKNAPALLAYYLGIASLMPVLGFFTGIAAVALGIRGLRKRRAEPHVKGSVHAWIGIVLGSLSLLVHVLIIVAMIVASVGRGR